MRNINSADPWQIAFYRGLAFLFSISLFLFHKYRLEIVTKIKNTGFPGIAGGFLLMLANLLFIQALANTSIANSLFTLSSIPFITAILAFIFLKEKISLKTVILMIFALLTLFGKMEYLSNYVLGGGVTLEFGYLVGDKFNTIFLITSAIGLSFLFSFLKFDFKNNFILFL